MSTASASILLDSLSALNDSARLRILRILEQHELSVGEISDVIQLPQSTASRHLKQLLDAGFVSRRTIGTTGLYRIASEMAKEVEDLWNITVANSSCLPETEEDSNRLLAVLSQRHSDSRSFFQNVGSDWESIRKDLFGSDFTSIALLSLLDQSTRVVDIGCGIGNAANIIAPFVQEVTGIDRESEMVEQATKRPGAASNVSFQIGDATNLPLEDNSVDVALFCLVLHHIQQATDAVREASRVVSKGGKILIIDMQSHNRDEYKHTMGHEHLGFSEDEVKEIAESTCCSVVNYHKLPPRVQTKGPSLFVAVLRVDH